MIGRKLNILVIEGTTREQRRSLVVAQFIADVGRQLHDASIRLADPTQFVFSGDGNDPEGQDPAYTKLVEWADAFFIVVPEYNHSFPGSLKRMLDSELQPYLHKPVALAGVSSGGWGGTRAVEHLVPVLRELGLVATMVNLYFPRVQQLFDDNGVPLDDTLTDKVKSSYHELLWMARTLKHGRDHFESL